VRITKIRRSLPWALWLFVPVIPAAAQTTVVIGVDTLQCAEFVENYYAGGLGSLGSGPGPNYGITFSSNAQVQTDSKTFLPACASKITGGQDSTNMPSPPNGMLFQSGSAATMNVAAGFTGGFSFYYAAPFYPGSVTVWSGLNGTGTLLANLTLPINGKCSGVPYYCVWSPIGVSFSGTAQSVNFGGSTDFIVFDSITLGVSLVVNPAKSSGNPSSKPGSCSCGDPVSVGTGNLFEQVNEYQTSGANVLGFTRYYNSLGTATFATTLGVSWRATFDRYIRINSSTSVTVERADGQQANFNLTGNTWTPDTDVDLQLTTSGSTWILKDDTDTTETYTTISTTEGLLASITARNGYSQSLHYNGSDQLTSVTDSYNRTLSFTYLSGLLHTVTTPDSLALTYSYTSSGANNRLSSVSYSTSPQTSQSYVYENASFPFSLTGIVDEDGNRYATWTYDQSGRVLTSQHAGGADLTTFAYNDTDGTRTVTNALGQAALYTFTTLQGVPKLAQIARQATSTTTAATRTFAYDANGYLASQTDWNGNLTTYVNDIHGQPTSINEAVGTSQARTATITYLSNYHLPSQIVTPGLTTSFTYDGSGELLTKTQTDTTATSVPYSTNGQHRTWTYTWSNFLLASALGPRSDVSELTKFAYDSTGALTATTNALGQITKITEHLPGGVPQIVVDPNGVTTTLSYDARLRLLASTVTTSAGPLATKYAYDAAGNLLSLTLPDGSVLTNTYDAAHRLTGMADLFKNSLAYTLDAAGDRIKTAVANPGGTATRQRSATFDALGRLRDEIGGVGQTTAYGYDANGNALTITDPLQRLTQQSFDAINRITQVTNPIQGKTATSYDPHDRPISVTDPNGRTTAYTYDGFGDLIQEVSPARGTTVYHYDLDGNLAQRVDARGAIANYTHDVLDRTVTTTYPADATENVRYTYDQAGGGFGVGRLTSVSDAAGTLNRTYDERGNVLTESRVPNTGATGVTLLSRYIYDGGSRITSITYPSGTVVTYARDGMGRVTTVTAQPQGATQSTPVLSKITYEPFGPANALTYGNGVTESRSFDLDYRLTTLSGAGNKLIQSFSYGYNAANDILSITDSVNSGNSQNFGYDALNRLTNASGIYGILAYTYDANGNRLTENPTAPIALDGLGSITSLAYSQSGRLASSTAGTQQITQYTYDAFGRRLAKFGTVTATTLFQYDSGSHLLEEANAQGGAQADYIYLDGRPVAELSAGKLYFLHDDRLGTPQVATDTTQATVWVGDYQPFGALTASSQTALLGQDLRLPGQENDLETGLYHNGFRDYVPAFGRYISSDPIGLAGALNTYGYARANPATFIDPTGRSSDTGTSPSPNSVATCSTIPSRPVNGSSAAESYWDFVNDLLDLSSVGDLGSSLESAVEGAGVYLGIPSLVGVAAYATPTVEVTATIYNASYVGTYIGLQPQTSQTLFYVLSWFPPDPLTGRPVVQELGTSKFVTALSGAGNSLANWFFPGSR
jgi:RHS repeat-associated protein